MYQKFFVCFVVFVPSWFRAHAQEFGRPQRAAREPREVKRALEVGRRKNLMHPESPDGIGELLAMSARTGEILWRHRTRTPPTTAALTTAGGLVVGGDFDRYLYVHDAATGRTLFQTRLPTSVQGFPITYAVNGRQYIAVPAGTGGGQWVTTIPAELTPEKKIAQGANAIFVFALPERRER